MFGRSLVVGLPVVFIIRTVLVALERIPKIDSNEKRCLLFCFDSMFINYKSYLSVVSIKYNPFFPIVFV